MAKITCNECKFCQAYYHGKDSKLGMFTYVCKRFGHNVKSYEWCDYARIETREVIERCRDCAYLMKKDNKWYCDNYEKFCNQIICEEIA